MYFTCISPRCLPGLSSFFGFRRHRPRLTGRMPACLAQLRIIKQGNKYFFELYIAITHATPIRRCPVYATCCGSKFSASRFGCCPWKNAVCCKNSLTCCPEGTECVDTIPAHWPNWGAVTTCKPSRHSNDQAAVAVQGKCVCKPGAPLPMSDTLKNVCLYCI